MQNTDGGRVLFRNTMEITYGHLDQFKEAVRLAVEFAEAHAPQLMVEVFIDEENMLAYSFQLYQDSDAIRTHWQLSDPYIQGVMEHCTVRSLDVYGRPDDAVRAALPAGEAEPSSRWTGFVRGARSATG